MEVSGRHENKMSSTKEQGLGHKKLFTFCFHADSASSCLMFEELDVLLPDEAFDGPMQMALDETLLRNVVRTTLRIYQWEAPCVSFGYFQKYSEVKATHPFLPLVRRWTGGGTVEHGWDLTFSLMVPQGVTSRELSPAQFYKILHHALAEAITRFSRMEITIAGDREILSGPACFTSPARDDLMWRGKKILGGAQRRSDGALLYQGSMQGCDEIMGIKKTAFLYEDFANSLSNRVNQALLSQTIKREASDLAQQRYRSEGWNTRR